MAGRRPSPHHPIPGSYPLASMKKPMGPSAVSDVEASKMAVPASAGPMSRVSEWRFEGPFRSDAKMFIAGPLATFVVGLVGYALSMSALILTAIVPGAIASRSVAVPEQYGEAGRVGRTTAGLMRHPSHTERRKQATIGMVDTPFGIARERAGSSDNHSLSGGSSHAPSSPAVLVPNADLTTPTSGTHEYDNGDATSKARSRTLSIERSMMAPSTPLPTVFDAGPSTSITRPPFMHKSSSLRRTLKGFKDAMHVRSRRQSSEMRNTCTPSPFTTDDEGVGNTEPHIGYSFSSPMESVPSVRPQSPTEASCSNPTNKTKLQRSKPFIRRLSLSSPNKQQSLSSSSSSLCPLSPQKQPKIKPPPLRTTYTYTFLPTSEDPFQEDGPQEQPELTSPSPSPAHSDSHSPYFRPFIPRSFSLPRGKSSYPTIPSRSRFPSDPKPVSMPLPPSPVSPPLMSIAASRQDALLELEGKGKGKGKMTDSLPVPVPISITVTTTAPVQQHQAQTQGGSRNGNSRCRRTGRLKFVRGSSSMSVSGTDDENAGVRVDEFGVVRHPVKRNSMPTAGEMERLDEDGSHVQQQQQHQRTGSMFGFGSGSGSGSKPPVSGTKRWKRISFS